MKNILITGASRGIGLEFVRQYLQAGDQVFACCRQLQQAQELQQLQQESERLQIYQLDITDSNQIQAIVQQLAGKTIDILINNAGIYGEREKLGHISVQNLMNVLLVNAVSQVKMSESFLDPIAASTQKKIVAITSLMGSISDNNSGDAYAYRASKAALNMLMKSLSIDVKDRDIKVLLLHPGWVKTRMGGEDAMIDAQVSVEGMRKQIENLTSENSGSFYAYDGRRLPW